VATTECMIEALENFRLHSGISDEQFWTIIERYRATLINQALPIVGNQQDAEDAAQETLCKAFLQLKQLKEVSKFGAWLRTINRCNALLVRRRRSRNKEERLSTGKQTALEARGERSEQDTARELILRAVDSLSDEYRDIVVLKYLERITAEEIAARLDLPVTTVRGRLERAHVILSRKLQAIRSNNMEYSAR